MLLTLLSIFFISFTDKSGSQPITFADRATTQRTQWTIPTDSLDYAVSPIYIDSLRAKGATILHTSRWFNGVTAYMPDALAEQVKTYSFVRAVELTRDTTTAKAMPRKLSTQLSEIDYGAAQKQLELYNLPPVHARGYEGQGILMAICDAGFLHADTMRCFDRAHCLGTFDFSDDAKGFFESSNHGTHCLSTIAGWQEDYRGSATQADYYLMRSEENLTESPKEMDNLVAAMEKADSLGVNIFSVSLGYFNFDNPAFNLSYQMMDGQHTRVARAATIAARKGILLVVAMGNEGDKTWHYLATPSDADSILSVGAVGLDSVMAAFSSYGPSYDGRVKPELCAVGYHTALINPSGKVMASNGTSFATPLIAGLAASVWSAMPTATAQEIRQHIIRSSHCYAQPDARLGYGIPNAEKALDFPTDIDYISLPLDGERMPKGQDRGIIFLNGHLYLRTSAGLFTLLGHRVFPFRKR